MKQIILMIFLSLYAIAFGYEQGDILFQESTSSQAPYIKKATGSRYTHCGIIYIKDGKEYVLEASDKVKLTPVKEWIARGVDKHVKVRKCPKKNFHIALSRYQGKPYDTSFSWTDSRMYCSELVYKIYKDNGITLCPLRLVSSYKVKGMEEYMKMRGISFDTKVVAPSDFLK